MTPLRRTASYIAIRAEFEYMYDDGDAVWGGRVSEEISCRVDPRLSEWSEPKALHGSWHGLRSIVDKMAAFDPDYGSQPLSAAPTEVEMSSISRV